MTKEERTKIHDAVKKAFGSSIVGSTVTVGDKKYVTFDKPRKGGGHTSVLYDPISTEYQILDSLSSVIIHLYLLPNKTSEIIQTRQMSYTV